MAFRDRLLATLDAVRVVLAQPGVTVVGSEVPNLLQPEAASTLVVSQDVDLAVPLDAHEPVGLELRGREEIGAGANRGGGGLGGGAARGAPPQFN